MQLNLSCVFFASSLATAQQGRAAGEVQAGVPQDRVPPVPRVPQCLEAAGEQGCLG